MTEGSISGSEGGEKRGAGAEETSEKDWRSQGRISIVGCSAGKGEGREKEREGRNVRCPRASPQKKERSKSLPRENPPEGKVGIAKTFGGSFLSFLFFSHWFRQRPERKESLNRFLLGRLVGRFAHFVLPSFEKKGLLLGPPAEALERVLRLQLLLCLS